MLQCTQTDSDRMLLKNKNCISFSLFCELMCFAVLLPIASTKETLINCKSECGLTDSEPCFCARIKIDECDPYQEKFHTKTAPKPESSGLSKWYISDKGGKHISLNLTWDHEKSHIGIGYVVHVWHEGSSSAQENFCIIVNKTALFNTYPRTDLFRFTYGAIGDNLNLKIQPKLGEHELYRITINALPLYKSHNEVHDLVIKLHMPDCCDQLYADTLNCQELFEYDLIDCELYYENSIEEMTTVLAAAPTEPSDQNYVLKLLIPLLAIITVISLACVIILYAKKKKLCIFKEKTLKHRILFVADPLETKENNIKGDKIIKKCLKNTYFDPRCNWRERENIAQTGLSQWFHKNSCESDLVVLLCFGSKTNNVISACVPNIPSKVVLCCQAASKVHNCLEGPQLLKKYSPGELRKHILQMTKNKMQRLGSTSAESDSFIPTVV